MKCLVPTSTKTCSSLMIQPYPNLVMPSGANPSSRYPEDIFN